MRSIGSDVGLRTFAKFFGRQFHHLHLGDDLAVGGQFNCTLSDLFSKVLGVQAIQAVQ